VASRVRIGICLGAFGVYEWCARLTGRDVTDALSFPKDAEKFPGPFFSRPREREVLPYGMAIDTSNPRIADFSQGIAVTT
jgi:hypothetical protein